MLNQNYLCYYEQYYKTSKGAAMGAPISSVTLKIFRRYYEQQITKHWLEEKKKPTDDTSIDVYSQ